jgi:hypothetical protein
LAKAQENRRYSTIELKGKKATLPTLDFKKVGYSIWRYETTKGAIQQAKNEMLLLKKEEWQRGTMEHTTLQYLNTAAKRAKLLQLIDCATQRSAY